MAYCRLDLFLTCDLYQLKEEVPADAEAASKESTTSGQMQEKTAKTSSDAKRIEKL